MTAPQAWDSVPRRHHGQGLLVIAAALLLLPAGAATVMRVFPPRDDATALVASFIPYAVLGYVLSLGLLLVAVIRARRRLVLGVLALAVAGLTAAHLAWLGPLFLPNHRPATTPTFTLLSLNLHNGEADPAEVAAQAVGADVVILIETTPDALRSLKPLGWDQRFPYAVGDIRDGLSDTAIYSRFPLGPGLLVGRTSFQQWLTTVQAPGVGTVRLAAAHPCNPYCGHNLWSSEHRALRSIIQPYLNDPLIVAGDLNAVDDHGPLLDLRRDGLVSATDLTGAGWVPTYPANRRFPPLLPIDHILVSHRLTVTTLRTFRVDGTDHLGLIATIAGTG